MNTRSEIKWINQELLKNSDPSVIQKIKDYLLTLKSDESNTPVTLEQYNLELEEGLHEIITGKGTTDEDLGKMIATW